VDRLPQVRIGINIGEVIEEDGDVFGLPVDAAEHIQSTARAGQILVSELVRGVVGAADDIQFLERGRFKLKNFPERWRLYELPWQTEQAALTPISRALLIADMVGAVSMFDRLGDEASLEAIRGFYAIARAQSASHGSDWAKTAGDTLLASFRSPSSAVICAIGMQRAFAVHNQEHVAKRLRVRIALHYGDVIREADEIFGHTLVVAVLMTQVGRAGDILVSSTLRQQVKDATVRFGKGRHVEFRD